MKGNYAHIAKAKKTNNKTPHLFHLSTNTTEKC